MRLLLNERTNERSSSCATTDDFDDDDDDDDDDDHDDARMPCVSGNLMVTAPRPQDISSATKIIPIDHAYCLPDFLHLGAPKYEWCECTQASEPASRATRRVVETFDTNRDAEVRECMVACVRTYVRRQLCWPCRRACDSWFVCCRRVVFPRH